MTEKKVLEDESKKFSKQLLGKTIVSKTGKRFGEVGDLIFETRSGELIHMVVNNPTAYTEKLELEKDKQSRILIPFSAVIAMVALCLLILLISRSVVVGSGMFCRRVMAKMALKVLLLNGVWSASARMTTVLGCRFARVFALLSKPSDVSSPTSSPFELLTCLKSRPVPHPMSSMMFLG